jgi:hypothetical protein
MPGGGGGKGGGAVGGDWATGGGTGWSIADDRAFSTALRALSTAGGITVFSLSISPSWFLGTSLRGSIGTVLYESSKLWAVSAVKGELMGGRPSWGSIRL